MAQIAARAPWWKRGVIYQIYPRSFQDADGNGIGDLNGIRQRLDYLAALGVDALWLSPIYRSPMHDFGYDVQDFCAIDPIFGTLDDFDALVADAHARGLKIVLDFVPNHTSSLHPWFLESRASRDNPKRDWYVWVDPGPNGAPPNNWLGYFGGPAWTLDATTGQYYLHNFLPEQPDLNYRNPAVTQAVFGDMAFWLDRGVDGFRLDVIDRLLKDPLLRDNPPNPTYVHGRDNPVEALLRVNSERGPGIYALMEEFQAHIHRWPERTMIGEIQYYPDPKLLVPYYGEREGQAMDLPFNFGPLLLPWNARAFREYVDAYEAVLPAHAWPNYVLGNHDQHRLATRVGGQAQARLAAMLLLTLRGTPFIYNGEELGLENVPIPPHLVQDPQGKNLPGYTRDVARTPMQWSADANAGFTTATPWLPLAKNWESVNVAAQERDPASMLTLYRRLLALRRASPALALGHYTSVDAPETAFVYRRDLGDERVLVALNFGADALTLALPAVAGEGAAVALSTHLDREEPADLNALRLRAHEGVLITLSAPAKETA